MPEIPPPDRTEELLRGADRPRPLPPELRQRLADQLIQAGRADATEVDAPATAGARPLPSDLRARLEDALPSEPPSDEGTSQRRWRTVRWTNPVTAVAAALVLLLAVVGLSIHGRGSNNPHVAATSGADKGARGAPPPASLSASGAGGTAAGTGGGANGGTGSAGAAPLNGPGGAAAGQSAAASGAGGGTSGGAASPVPSAAAPLAPPTVSGVSPSTGPTAGGTWVTVTGQNLGEATHVHFGTAPARQLVVVSATAVRALSPPHGLGTVDVTVETPGGTSAVVPADRYTFLP